MNVFYPMFLNVFLKFLLSFLRFLTFFIFFCAFFTSLGFNTYCVSLETVLLNAVNGIMVQELQNESTGWLTDGHYIVQKGPLIGKTFWACERMGFTPYRGPFTLIGYDNSGPSIGGWLHCTRSALTDKVNYIQGGIKPHYSIGLPHNGKKGNDKKYKMYRQCSTKRVYHCVESR